MVVKNLEQLFSLYGIPEVLKSDNGPSFNSKAFKDFAKYINMDKH